MFGPADATAENDSDAEPAGLGIATNKQRDAAASLHNSAAVFDTKLDAVNNWCLWNTAIQKYKVLQALKETIVKIPPVCETHLRRSLEHYMLVNT